jgi:heme/copper-type cytochrome/quinol oxidase subunit 2
MSCYNRGFHFEVTPQKRCCLWPNSKECQKYNNVCDYCCGPGFHGRPLKFNYTPDSERWKKCGKFQPCNNGRKQMISRPGCYIPSGVI